MVSQQMGTKIVKRLLRRYENPFSLLKWTGKIYACNCCHGDINNYAPFIFRLFSENGFPYLVKEFPKLKFKGKGEEVCPHRYCISGRVHWV